MVVLREWFGARRPSDDPNLNAAERRKLEWEFKKQRRWSFAAATLCAVVVISLAAEFAYARVTNAQSPATILRAQNGEVRIPLADLRDTNMHFYTADANNVAIRFFVIHESGGDYVVALDACQICGWSGYRQQGQNVVCRNCGATIYIPSIGAKGGCNPIPVKSSVEDGSVVVDLSALETAASKVHS
jgi:high-affinity iron transporter